MRSPWCIPPPSCTTGSPCMAERRGVHLCASAELAERGTGWLFDVVHHGETMRAFALRIDGRPVAYLNRCSHVPTELDWQPGRFLDDDGAWILCTVHGAAYEPASGRCAGGPCGRRGLTTVEVDERDGEVYWYPSSHLRPVFDDEDAHG